MKQNQFLLVEARVLPEVFRKVIEAKQMLARAEVGSLSEAARLAGISRSALYKYKDSVFVYQGEGTRRIITIFCELMDEPGVLSSLLTLLGSSGANILTINQNIPVDGVAPVSISMRTEGIHIPHTELFERAAALEGVVNMRLLAGE